MPSPASQADSGQAELQPPLTQLVGYTQSSRPTYFPAIPGPSSLVTQNGNIHGHSQHHPIAHCEHRVENKEHPFPPEWEYHASPLTTSTILFLDPPPSPISPTLLQYPLLGSIYFHFRKRRASDHSTYWKLQLS